MCGNIFTVSTANALIGQPQRIIGIVAEVEVRSDPVYKIDEFTVMVI